MNHIFANLAIKLVLVKSCRISSLSFVIKSVLQHNMNIVQSGVYTLYTLSYSLSCKIFLITRSEIFDVWILICDRAS